jgi:phage terminase large subunit
MKNEQWHLTPVFEAIHNATEKVIILQGGTSSSKTYSAMQSNILYCIYNPNHIVTVTGESIPNLKKGAYRDAETIYANSPWFQSMVSQWNKTDRTIEFKNGAKMEFISNLDEQSAKAGKRDRLFVDEANGIPWGIFFQLAIRTKGQIMIAYNPSAPFWAHDKLIGTTPSGNDLSATVKFLRSWHEHNTALSEDEHRKIEGIKDPDLFRVYARGLTGNLVGLIFPDWKMAEFPADNDLFYGLDIGWSNDPCALYRCARIGNNIFVDELLYETNKSPRDVLNVLKANGYQQDSPVYTDHAPEFIRELRQLEVLSIAARKGQGSINAGIMKLKEYNVFYSPKSVNLIEELKRYMWIIDPSTGKPTNIPTDSWNHGIDAVRYACYTHFYRGQN